MYLGIIPYMGVSKNRGITKSSHFNRVFHYKPSILRYHYFWKHPYTLSNPGPFFHCSIKIPWKNSPPALSPSDPISSRPRHPKPGRLLQQNLADQKNPDGFMDLLAQKNALKGTCFFSHPPKKRNMATLNSPSQRNDTYTGIALDIIFVDSVSLSEYVGPKPEDLFAKKGCKASWFWAYLVVSTHLNILVKLDHLPR